MCAWTRQRTDFNVQEFYRIIEQKGYIVNWSKASVCPCIPKDGPGQPDFNCPLCYGKGRYWYDAQTIKGIMTNFNDELKYNQIGETLAGTSYFTTLATNKLSFWDRLSNRHSKVRYSEVVIKGTHGGTDNLRFVPLKVLSLRTISTVYQSNVDFTVDSKTSIVTWLPIDNEPNSGERYSIEYMMHPSWIVIDLPNVLRDTYIKHKLPGIGLAELPVRAVVRLEYFVF
jgi:hypothetical protein